MKRNQSGQFTNSWDSEAKQKVSLSLTATAWEILDQHARTQGLSKSELVERFARSLEAQQSIPSIGSNQLNTVINTMTEGLIIADPQGNILEFNPTALTIHGFDSLEQVQRHFSEFFDSFEVRDLAGNFVPLEHWAMSRVLRGESYTGYELQIYRNDIGIHFTGSYSGSPVYDAEGNLSLAILTLRDITLEKQTQADLIHSQQRLETVLNAIPHAVWVIGADRDFYFNNQQWRNYYGVSFEEATLNGWSQVHPDDRDRIMQRWETAQETRSTYEAEFRWCAEDGTVRWYLCRAVPLLDETGQIIEWVGSNTDITQLKQIGAELQHSHQFIQQVAEMLPGLLYVYDLTEHRNVYVNRESAALLGYTPEQIQAMGTNMMATLLHPEDLPRMIAAQETLHTKRDGETAELDYRMRHANGDWRWIYDRAVTFNRTPDGQTRQILGFAIDMSDRKAAEVALRQSESRLRRVVDGPLVGILFWRSDGLITQANDVVLDLIGYSRAELEAGQLRWTELTPPGWETIETIALQELADRGVCTPYEKEYYHKDGSRIPILLGSSALEAGSDEGIAFIVDIRDRKAAETALRHSEERLRRALDAARIVAWEWTPATNQVIYSHTAVEVFGIESAAEIRTSEEALALVHPNDLRSHQLRIAAAITAGRSFVSTFRLIRPDTGETVWMEDRGNVVNNDGDTSLKVTGMVMDISERVRLEQERDRVFQQEQAAREAAETANRIKDEFLMVLSHELRTPLNPILGWIKLLRAGRLSAEKTNEVLATIERNAQLQAQLIEDLLDVSKILRGKLTLNLKTVNLAIPTRAAIATVQLSADAKQITIDQRITDAIVLGDESRLQQIVWNLLSNAVKFTPDNGQIQVSLTSVDQIAQIQVKDTGKGIAPEFLPHVFEHFRQQDSSTTRRFGGLGLGLAIVRQIAELHGGSVLAQSEGEGQGATFTVRIPLSS